MHWGLKKAVARGKQTEWLENKATRLDELLSNGNGVSALRMMLPLGGDVERASN
ncbi:MAG TPA: hypothetical protein VGR78_06240 [Verrucomicrobiae bacterium]|jgi:hypothetical protein|nr:hypothetical protein [Verrucomicrobiae bacterium]